jgi:hypothetical protein
VFEKARIPPFLAPRSDFHTILIFALDKAILLDSNETDSGVA